MTREDNIDNNKMSDKKDSTKDEDFKIVTEIEKRKEYLRKVCPEFKKFEFNILEIISATTAIYKNYLDKISRYSNDVNASYRRLLKFINRHNLPRAEIVEFDLFFNEIMEEFDIETCSINNLIYQLKQESKSVDFYANKLFSILETYSKNADSAFTEKICEDSFNFRIAEMNTVKEELVDQIFNKDAQLKWRMQVCQDIVGEFDAYVDQFIVESTTKREDSEEFRPV